MTVVPVECNEMAVEMTVILRPHRTAVRRLRPRCRRRRAGSTLDELHEHAHAVRVLPAELLEARPRLALLPQPELQLLHARLRPSCSLSRGSMHAVALSCDDCIA